MEPKKALTVTDVVKEMEASYGFVLFVSLLVKNEKGEMSLEHRYMRNTYIPEDLAKSFESFQGMIKNDLKESSENIIKAAEAIKDMDLNEQEEKPKD